MSSLAKVDVEPDSPTNNKNDNTNEVLADRTDNASSLQIPPSISKPDENLVELVEDETVQENGSCPVDATDEQKAEYQKKIDADKKIKDNAETVRQKSLSWKLLKSILWEQKCLLISCAPLLLLGQVGEVCVPYYVGLVMDAMQRKCTEDVHSLIIQWVCILVGGAVCAFLQKLSFGYLSEEVGRSLRLRTFTAAINKDITFFDKTTTGSIISRLNNDTQKVQEGLTTSFAMMISGFFNTIFVLAVMATQYSGVTTIFAFLLIIPGGLVAPIYNKYNMVYVRQMATAKAQGNGIAEERMSNIRTVKAFADEQASSNLYKDANDAVYATALKKGRIWGFFMFGMMFFRTFALLCMILIVTKSVENKDLSTGQVISYLLYMQQMTSKFGEMLSQYAQVKQVTAAAMGIAAAINAPTSVQYEGSETPKFPKDDAIQIECEDVEFCYPNKPDVPILRGVSLKVPVNNVVALVGASGCGKSSIINLVERWYDPEMGKFSYNGKDLKEIDNKWLHQTQIALVQQEPILFSSSIRANIIYGVDFTGFSQEEIDEKLDKACKDAHAYDFIHDKEIFPEGYDTAVGERGVRLSGGQKQRVAIARALVRDPQVILLDEATSALDAESEHQVQKALDILMAGGGKTIMVIAHRLSTIRNANNIVCLKYGEIVEQGSHDELVRKDGVYKALVDRQLTKEKTSEEIV